MVRMEEGGKANLARLLKFVEGNELNDFKELPESIFIESGILAARLLAFLSKLSQQ